MANRFRNVSRTVARSNAALPTLCLHTLCLRALCLPTVTAAALSASALIASTVATPSAAQGEYVRELPPDFTEPPAGPPTPACVNRLRSLGSPVEFSVLTTHADGSNEPYASGRLFRAGPAQPYSNLAASGRSVTVYLDGFVCLEENRRRWITAFRGQCRGDELVGSDGKDVWVLSFRSGSARSN